MFQSIVRLAEAGEEHNPLLPIWIEVVLSLVVFGLLVLAFAKWVIPNFEKTFAERTTAIEGGLKAAETKQAEADAKLADLDRQLSEARHEAARIREEAREQGAAIIAEMREQAQAESVAHRRARQDPDRGRASAGGRLAARRGRCSLATGLAGRIVGESLEDEARQSRVVERFLEELETSGTRERGPSSHDQADAREPPRSRSRASPRRSTTPCVAEQTVRRSARSSSPSRRCCTARRASVGC